MSNPILERINEVFDHPTLKGLAEAAELLSQLVTQLQEQVDQFDEDIQQVADDLAQHIIDAAADLAAHAAETATHGITSNIVGETEEQSLDNKTIGSNTPGYGRFSPLLVSQKIEAGEVVQVPADNGLLGVDILDVQGELNVDGSVVVV